VYTTGAAIEAPIFLIAMRNKLSPTARLMTPLRIANPKPWKPPKSIEGGERPRQKLSSIS